MANRIVDLVFFIAIIALFGILFKEYKNQEESLNKGIVVVNFWNPSNSLLYDTTQKLPFESNTGTFKKFYLTGIENSDSLKLMELKEAFKNFNEKMDEGPGIHIVFGDSSKYGDFIKVLDYCSKENIRQYLPYRNNIWIPAKENLIK